MRRWLSIVARLLSIYRSLRRVPMKQGARYILTVYPPCLKSRDSFDRDICTLQGLPELIFRCKDFQNFPSIIALLPCYFALCRHPSSAPGNKPCTYPVPSPPKK